MGTAREKREHRRTQVHGVRLEVRVGGEEARGESAIAVAEDKSTAAVGEGRQEVIAATSQGGAEGEVLEPVVGRGDEVEVRGDARAHRRKGRISAGVRRTRSAAARRWVRER